MNKKQVELYRDRVVGLRPVYTPVGDGTEVILEGGTVAADSRSLKGALKAFFRSYAIDPSAQKGQIQEMLGRRALLPFLVPEHRTFIPLKMRKAVTENDATYGYIEVDFIQSVDSGDGKHCSLTLRSGQKIELCSDKSTAITALHLGRQLKTLCQGEQSGKREASEILNAAHTISSAFVSIRQQLNRIEELLDRGG